MFNASVNRIERQAQLAHVARILEECQSLSKKVGVEVLHASYPGMSKSFFHSRFELLVTLTPETLASAIGYPDPVGERAVHRAMTRRKARTPQPV